MGSWFKTCTTNLTCSDTSELLCWMSSPSLSLHIFLVCHPNLWWWIKAKMFKYVFKRWWIWIKQVFPVITVAIQSVVCKGQCHVWLSCLSDYIFWKALLRLTCFLPSEEFSLTLHWLFIPQPHSTTLLFWEWSIFQKNLWAFQFAEVDWQSCVTGGLLESLVNPESVAVSFFTTATRRFKTG